MSALEQRDIICDAFEEAWLAGLNPIPREYAALAPEPIRHELTKELVRIELDCVKEHGVRRKESPTVDQDATQTPSSQLDKSTKTLARGDTLSGTARRTPLPVHQLPSHIGRYLIEAEIGRGGCGVVYRAEDVELNRVVAIKTTHPSIVTGDDLELFIREAKTSAHLDHKGIVRVYDVGEDRGVPFLVSELVHGKNLNDFLRDGNKLTFAEIANVIADVADAIEYAHQHGVIHRDIKPSNIMLEAPARDESDELVAETDGSRNYKARILDFGVARLIGRNTLLTRTGHLVGTPVYMSPEQASGQANKADRRSDVYALGVVLYELICGTPPYVGDPVLVLDQIRRGNMTSIPLKNPEAPEGLAKICHQSLRIDPNERYQTAADLATDLRNWVRRQPINARNFGWLYRLTHPKQWSQQVVVSGLMLAVCSAAISITAFLMAPKSTATFSDQWVAHLPDRIADLPSMMDTIDEVPIQQLVKMGRLLQQSPHRLEVAKGIEQFRVTDKSFGSARQLMLAGLNSMLDASRPIQNDPPHRYRNTLLSEATDETAYAWGELFENAGPEFLESIETSLQTEDSEAHRQTLARFLVGAYHQSPKKQFDVLNLTNTDEIGVILDGLVQTKEDTLDFLAEETVPSEFGYDAHGEAAAKRAANVLLVRYQLGMKDSVWSHLQVQSDPRLRTYFVHHHEAIRADISAMLECIQTQSPSVQYAMLECLALRDPSALLTKERQGWMTWLKATYETHSDSGVHMMCRHVMRNWGHESELRAIDERLQSQGMVEGRDWYVNSLGMQMLIMRGPVEFFKGLRDDVPDKEGVVVGQMHRIEKSYAISADEVTIAQYRVYNPDYTPLDGVASEESRSVNALTWYEAMKFCEWLNQAEGLAQENAPLLRYLNEVEFEVEMEQSLYRLPTCAEWEYAARGGAKTRRFFGELATPFSSSYFAYEDIYANNPQMDTFHPIPNRYGLRNTIGGVVEWTASRVSNKFGKPDSTILSDQATMDSRGLAQSIVERQCTVDFPYLQMITAPRNGFRVCRVLSLQ